MDDHQVLRSKNMLQEVSCTSAQGARSRFCCPKSYLCCIIMNSLLTVPLTQVLAYKFNLKFPLKLTIPLRCKKDHSSSRRLILPRRLLPTAGVPASFLFLPQLPDSHVTSCCFCCSSLCSLMLLVERGRMRHRNSSAHVASETKSQRKDIVGI